jgi:hypothetical protein
MPAHVVACSIGSRRALSARYVGLEDKTVSEGASWRNLSVLTSSSCLNAAWYSAHRNKLPRQQGLVAPGYYGCLLTGCQHYNELFTCKFAHHNAQRRRCWKPLWYDFRRKSTLFKPQICYRNVGHPTRMILILHATAENGNVRFWLYFPTCRNLNFWRAHLSLKCIHVNK